MIFSPTNKKNQQKKPTYGHIQIDYSFKNRLNQNKIQLVARRVNNWGQKLRILDQIDQKFQLTKDSANNNNYS